MYQYLGNQKLAEKILRFAAKLDPWSSQTWYETEISSDMRYLTAELHSAFRKIYSPLSIFIFVIWLVVFQV